MQQFIEHWPMLIITIIGTIAASSGFWAWLQRRHEKHDTRTRILLGIVHDRITYLAMLYIERGSITEEEFKNINDNLYIPYKELGGNGTVNRFMSDVEKLPIKSSAHYT